MPKSTESISTFDQIPGGEVKDLDLFFTFSIRTTNEIRMFAILFVYFKTKATFTSK